MSFVTSSYTESASNRLLRSIEADTAGRSVANTEDRQFAMTVNETGTANLWEATILDYAAPIVVSRIVASETALKSEFKYLERLRMAQQAMERQEYVTAAENVRQARTQAGFEREHDALEIWNDLYLKLWRTGLNGAWEKVAADLNHTSASSLSLSRDGKLLLSADPGSTNLWDTATGELLRTFDVRKSLSFSCLSPDGNYALFSDGAILLYLDTQTDKCLQRFDDHERIVSSGPDGVRHDP